MYKYIEAAAFYLWHTAVQKFTSVMERRNDWTCIWW